MPEQPDPKVRPHPWQSNHAVVYEPHHAQRHGYAELHVTSNFTFLTGASHPDEMGQAAARSATA